MSIKKIDFGAIIESCPGKTLKSIDVTKLRKWLKKRRFYKNHVVEVKQILESLGYRLVMPMKWSMDAADDLKAAHSIQLD